MSDPPGGADEPSDTRHEPRSDGAWSELVRATVADGFLAPPLQHDGPVSARRSMRRASAWSLRQLIGRRGSGTPPAASQALLDYVRATLGRKAPDPLEVPDQTQSFVSVIGRGFSTMWTRLTAALPQLCWR